MISQWPEPVRRARELVMQYGWNATAYQIVNPGIDHWFSADGDAVVGYVDSAGMRVVAGAPVSTLQRLPDVIREFEKASLDEGRGVCYFGAEARLEGALRDSRDHSMALLGAQPAWSPRSWIEKADRYSSLRAQFNRASNKGVTVHEWPAAEATGSSRLSSVLNRWLEGRGLPPMHFLVEPSTLERLDDRRIFVASRVVEHGKTADQILAFRCIVSGSGKKGLAGRAISTNPRRAQRNGGAHSPGCSSFRCRRGRRISDSWISPARQTRNVHALRASLAQDRSSADRNAWKAFLQFRGTREFQGKVPTGHMGAGVRHSAIEIFLASSALCHRRCICVGTASVDYREGNRQSSNTGSAMASEKVSFT
jgi:Uncharacterized conserved protein